MPRQLTQYRVFIASPSGLNDERQRFRDRLNHHTLRHSEPRGIIYQPVGWEETLGGVGRPQELINADIRDCDYAVFVLHDHWGSPSSTGSAKTGIEEEWELVEELYKTAKIRNIALFFKAVDAGKMSDPGAKLAKVLDFCKRIEEGKRYLFCQYESMDQFSDTLDGHWPNGSATMKAPPAVWPSVASPRMKAVPRKPGLRQFRRHPPAINIGLTNP